MDIEEIVQTYETARSIGKEAAKSGVLDTVNTVGSTLAQTFNTTKEMSQETSSEYTR